MVERTSGKMQEVGVNEELSVTDVTFGRTSTDEGGGPVRLNNQPSVERVESLTSWVYTSVFAAMKRFEWVDLERRLGVHTHDKPDPKKNR